MVSRVTKQRKTYDLRKLENIRNISKPQCSVHPPPPQILSTLQSVTKYIETWSKPANIFKTFERVQYMSTPIPPHMPLHPYVSEVLRMIVSKNFSLINKGFLRNTSTLFLQFLSLAAQGAVS